MSDAEEAYGRRATEVGLELLARLAEGRSLVDLPDGVHVLAQGSWHGPFAPPGPTPRGARIPQPPPTPDREDVVVFEMEADGGFLVVTMGGGVLDGRIVFAGGGYGEPAPASALDPSSRPSDPEAPLLEALAGLSTGGWSMGAYRLRADVAAASVEGRPVEVPPHGVLPVVGTTGEPSVVELRDASGATMWRGTAADVVDVLVSTGQWPR